MKDRIYNFYLNILSRLRREFDYHSNKPFDLSGYKLVEILNQQNTYNGYKWSSYGNPYHPDNLDQYWQDENVLWVENKVILYSKYQPKTFNGITIPYSTGVVVSKNAYQYGYFEAVGMFPTLRGQWSAFWMAEGEVYPPEIDIVEGYSHQDKYRNGRCFESNIHYTDGLKTRNAGALEHPIEKDPSHYVACKFALLWEKDLIEIYYDDYLVRRVTDKAILDKINIPLRLIVNSAIQKRYNPSSFASTIFTDIKIYQKCI